MLPGLQPQGQGQGGETAAGMSGVCQGGADLVVGWPWDDYSTNGPDREASFSAVAVGGQR